MALESLIRELSVNLEDALKTALRPNEQLMVAIGGAVGSALMVTDDRVAVLQDGEGLESQVNVQSYYLSQLSGAHVSLTQMGGMLTLDTTVSVPEEKRSIFYPINLNRDFEMAAQLINESIKTQTKGVQMNSQSYTQSPTLTCPACSSVVSEDGAFCATCGIKLKDICLVCSRSIPIGARFCPHCGSESTNAITECPGCSSRVNSAVMSYCPQCGVSIAPRCASCGGNIVSGWPRCRYCGREIGSEVGYSMQRIRGMAGNGPVNQASSSQEEPEAEITGNSPGAAHNVRGTKFFEEEKLEEAIEAFNAAVALEPNNASYHCNLAVAYDELDQDDDAGREYECALELNPNEITALLYYGYMLNENGNPQRAAQLWKRIIEIAPGTPEAEEAVQNLTMQEEL